MVKKSKKKAPSKAKTVDSVEMPPPPPPPPRVSIRPTKSTATRKSSVIMLSSPESSFGEDPSLILNEPSISIIDLARPSTRMSLVEMDMTDLSDPRFSTRSPTTNDDTDLSLTNIVQTPGVAHRDRPKSSWVMRRTRSKSMAPPPPPPSLIVPENASEDVERPSRSRRTQSGDFVTVTRRARSVRPPARYLESIDENGGSVSKRPKGVQKKPVPETPRVVRNNEVPKTPAVTPGISRVTKRKRNMTKEKVAEEDPFVPEEPQSSQATSEEESNKSLETTTMSMVSIRRRRPERPPSPEYALEIQVEEPIPAVQAIERPTLPEEPVVGPSPIPAVRPQARSHVRPPINVTKTRNRAVERPALPKESIVEPEPTPAIRPRAKSAYRSRQPRLEGATRTRSRQVARSPSPEYPPELTTPAPSIRSRARSASRSLQLSSESVTKTRSRPIEHLASPENPVVETAIRPRARSASRSRKPRLDGVTSTRRRQVARSPSPEYPPEEPNPTPANRSRARSASRSLQLPSESVTKTRSRPVEHLASPENPVVEPSVRSRARSASRSKQKPSESTTGTRSPQKVARSPSPAKPTSTARPRARSASRPRQPLSESATKTRSRQVARSPSPQNPPEEPTAIHQPAVEPPIRPRTRSASRSRQPLQESISRPKRITKIVSKCPCCVNGESHHEPVRGRPRTRSELPAKTAKSTRSKSVVQEAEPKSPPPRSKSVSREAHVPVYRLPVEVPAVVKPTTEKVAAIVEDVYAFDSPGLLGLESDGGKKKKQRKGGSVKKKAKLEGSMRGKRVTPAKKNPLVATIFGTDMHKITRVVKKIGGGPVKRPPTPLETVSLVRPASPAISNYDPVDENDHFAENDVPMENVEPEIAQPVIIPASLPPPPVNRVNPLIERVLQQRPETPDRTAPPNVTLSFSPLGASSPWRVQDENVLPRTFYFSRSKDLLPSYESDVVVKDANVRPKTPVAETVPDPAPVSPAKQPSPPAAITGAKAEAMFQSIQKSYEQLKVTSEMSNKLITAMRKYKSTVHDQSLASVSASGELPEDERLIAKFREYEANMKKTYQKLKQWYERSQQQLTHSIKTIEQVSAVPKTLAQRQVLDNFRRDSKVFLSMMNELESAMNDSNVENVSPPVVDKPTFKDVVILTERNLANRNRSPLKTLEIANVPTRFSPIKSPLVRSSFTAFPTKPKPTATQTVPTTTTENAPKKDLFGFETDDSEEQLNPTGAAAATTPIKITKQTLKERLESVRKMLPPRPPAASRTYSRSRETATHRMPHVIGSPSRKQPRSVQSVFTSSTPVAAQKRNQATSSTRRGQLTEPLDADLSAIVDEPEPQAVPSPPPPEALFDDLLASTSLCSAVNRTYSRIPRRNHKRKRNVYLADLGLSDDEDEDEEDEHEHDSEHEAEQQQDEEYNGKTRKQATKKRRVAAGKKKKNAVEETNEFKQFVSEFNSMCEEVDRYKLVIEKPAVVAGGARQRV